MIYIEALDGTIQRLEYILEGDQRTFNNQETDEDWYYDKIYNALKILKEAWREYYERS